MLCPNRNSQEWKDLVEEVGLQEAYREWIKNNYSLEESESPEEYANILNTITKETENPVDEYFNLEKGDTINVQRSNIASLEKGDKTISVRKSGSHNFKVGKRVRVVSGGKKTNTIVKIQAIIPVEDFTKISKLRKDDFARSIGSYKDYDDLIKSDDYAREDSPLSMKFPEFYHFLNGDIAGDIIKYSKVEPTKEEKEKFIEYKPKKERLLTKNIKFFRDKLKKLKKEIQELDPQTDTGEINYLTDQINQLGNSLEILRVNEDLSVILDLGRKELDDLSDAINQGLVKTEKDLVFAKSVIDEFIQLPELSTQAGELDQLLDELKYDIVKGVVNTYSTKGKDKEIKDIEDLLRPTEDINSYRKNIGALADTYDNLGFTIAAMTKASQNRISFKNKVTKDRIEKEINALYAYAKKAGIPFDKLYDPFIQEYRNTYVLTMSYTTEWYNARNQAFGDIRSEEEKLVEKGKKWLAENTDSNSEGEFIAKGEKWINKQYNKIQNTPELKRFYEFHKEIINEGSEQMPTRLNENFIPNIKNTLFQQIAENPNSKDIIASLKESMEDTFGLNSIKEKDFLPDEEFFNDNIVPKYIAKLDIKEKSRDLGLNLYKFASFANNYEEMSELLPKVRIIQQVIKDKQYIDTHGKKTISGENSNIFALTNTFVAQQIKGITKVDDFSPQVTKIIDFGLKYNSLLRIGLNPFNAVTNVVIGEFSNRIEAAGGKFFNHSQYNQGVKIFTTQNLDKDSKLNKILEKLLPLQELTDYENEDYVRLKSDKGLRKIFNLDIMYSPQKMGEKYLQTTTMIASMLHDKIVTKSGEKINIWEAFDEEGNWKTETIGYELDEIGLGKMSDKIQRVNQMIHGRYSSRDAAAWQQHVIYRMMSQFKKWIPTALENRFGEEMYDSRLQSTVEGRYRTFARIAKNSFVTGKYGFGKLFSDLLRTRKELTEGKYFSETELYNMRKNITEIIIILATMAMYAGFKGDDDKIKNPAAKYVLTILNTAAGDMELFYNPRATNKLLLNAIPLAKTVDDVLLAATYTPYMFGGDIYGGKDAEYRRGSRKNENKFWSRAGSVLPGYKPARDFIRLFNDSEYEER